MSTKPAKSDDTRELVEQARSFSKQFGALLQVAAMLDGVAGLKEEFEQLTVKRDQALHELNVLFGERDAELKVLTQQIEDRVRSEHAEAERLLQNETAMRASVENLKEEIANSHRVLTGLQAQVFRAESQYSDLTTKLGALRGAIPA